MTEDQAREVLLLQSLEQQGSPHWSTDDAAWATQQALAALGPQATPEALVTTRAGLAMPRLQGRLPAAAAAPWRGRGAGWVLLALALGCLLGLAIDQLGAPQRVNLLAPALWAVVAWNAAVYALALLPALGRAAATWLQQALAAPLAAAGSAFFGRGSGAAATWARHARPLWAARAALLLHAAAGGLALGLIAGLYLRGLVMDYRAGWQSTFLDAATVQALLGVLLAPAAGLTGIAVPAVAPLQLAPGALATASAAPWIHLFAATLLLAVVLPRLLLAAHAARQAARLAQDFPLPLQGAYFEALHPLMRQGPVAPLTLLWVEPLPLRGAARLLRQAAEPPDDGVGLQTLLASEDGDRGDQLALRALPPALQALLAAPGAALPSPPPWWQFWRRPHPARQAWLVLQDEVDAILWVVPAADPLPAPPPWLAAGPRPLLVLVDDVQAPAPALPLRALGGAGLVDGRFWQALAELLPDDRRRQRLQAHWQALQRRHVATTAQRLAGMLSRIARAQVPAEAADAAEAEARLLQQLEGEWALLVADLGALWQAGAVVSSAPGLQPQQHKPLPEGRAALVGGMVSGALVGLKADVASGGLTLGAGAIAGGVIGALGAAGVVRGLNRSRSVGPGPQAHMAWGAAELEQITRAALALALELIDAGAAPGPDPLAPETAVLAAAWRERGPTLADRLAPALERAVSRALEGADYTRPS